MLIRDDGSPNAVGLGRWKHPVGLGRGKHALGGWLGQARLAINALLVKG